MCAKCWISQKEASRWAPCLYGLSLKRLSHPIHRPPHLQHCPPYTHPLLQTSQWEVWVTAGTLIFPLWVHLPAEKGSHWCNLKPRSTPRGTLVFPVPSIFSMKFLCLSLTEGGEKLRPKEETKLFFFFFLFAAQCQRVERRSLRGWEAVGIHGEKFVFLLYILFSS